MSETVERTSKIEVDGVDIEELRAKYRQERERRLRPERQDQYVEAVGKYARYLTHDPFATTRIERDPIQRDVEILIIGGGWAGLMCAARMKEAGLEDVLIVEGGSDFGGTWYWNRYPGAQCDVESYCYLPLLEETGYIPKEKYSYAPEIYAHARRIGEHFGLYDITLFQTLVEGMRWDEDSARWIVPTDRGDELRARFVINAVGLAHRPKLPRIPGLDSFKGRTFHTSRWDYDYTGGDHKGDLHKLTDKTVAIIGTGATAVQCVPALGASAQQLYVFQRTPSAVDLRRNRPTDPNWSARLTPGWQLRRQMALDRIALGELDEELSDDAWVSTLMVLAAAMSGEQDPQAARLNAEIADFREMNRVRGRVDEVVRDRETAELLKPWYGRFCKRPTFNDEYLETFNRPNVTLVDTSLSRGVECITPEGLIANGVEYKVDCIIFSTGFELNTGWRKRIGYPVYGRDGVLLYDKWAEGAQTLHGFGTNGFPNWFYIGVGQNGMSNNYAIMLEGQARQLAYILTQARERAATRVEVTREGETAWLDEVQRTSFGLIEYQKSCTPGYYNNEGLGAADAPTFQNETFAPGVLVFNDILEAWRAAGKLEGLSLS